MRKIFPLFCLIVGLAIFTGSCSKSDSYAERLKQEKKSINRFIADNKIVVLDLYPANSKFAENEFYRDPNTGVYVNVVDTGNGKRVIPEKRSEVYMRFSDTHILSDTTKFSNDESNNAPLSFIYGVAATYMGTSSSDYYTQYFMSSALVAPLSHVGEGGVVRLIVPFTQGSYYQMYTNRVPFYYGKVKYTKIYNN